MLSAQARLLLRLIPRSNYYAQKQVNEWSFSPLQSSHSLHYCCLPTGTGAPMQAHKLKPAGFCLLPRRSLAGDSKEDFILHRNSLSEAEKKDIDSSVKEDFKDWIPYGFNLTDKEDDIFRYKMFIFSSLTLGVVVTLYVYLHLPPRNRREWVTREAYLELERRKRLGLPLVDRNLIPAEQVLLPSLEELGDDYDILI